ncbi:Smr/MutS family protein [Rhodovulum sp. FJ3]|uniref:Smr/MutS family protein n=1 Tax=Rhodovulum sp. FJ3 TaxID=3079053 RepID=UPI00293DC9AB|nr:Smr/MutS family protein [Rhodovulum sp. FJ3]MDV4169148.1 Smr/MutS family protein [Rhodovulum sp. FJ3]
MRRRPPRNLNSEERKLWQKVAETAQPMHARRMSDTPKTEPVSPQKSKTPPTPRDPIGAFQVGALSPAKGARHHLAPSIEDAVAAAPVQMDRKNYDRLRKGKMVPEAKIDLHGMTMSQAHPALVNFVMRNHGRGARLVLVITGKGKSADDGGPIPVRHGVLKHQVPQWLALPPLRGVVLQVTQAHQKHGGGGAYYVYLRRTR